jgi:hypothetical protein
MRPVVLPTLSRAKRDRFYHNARARAPAACATSLVSWPFAVGTRTLCFYNPGPGQFLFVRHSVGPAIALPELAPLCRPQASVLVAQ